MPKVDVSIIIPAFNSERWIATAIESAIYQSGPAKEVIVIDDGSTDRTADVCRSFKDAISFISRENRGASASRNDGISISRGHFLKFLDSDDYLLPNCLALQLEHVEGKPSNTISFGRTLRLNQNTGVLQPHSRRDACEDNADSVMNLLIDPPVTSSLLFSRDLVESVGGWNTHVKLMDDFDFFARCLLKGGVPKASKAPIYVYRNHDSPHRLSRSAAKSDFASLCAMFSSLASLYLEQRHSLDHSQVGTGLARTAWIRGRAALRLGYTEEATSLLSLARTLSEDPVAGRAAYRVLVSGIGPVAAERMLELLKSGLRAA